MTTIADIIAQDWRDEAVCAQTDPELWFPEKGGSATQAKGVCGGCPVRAECLQWALANGETDGIWGGLTPGQRKKLMPKRENRRHTAARERRQRIAEMDAQGMGTAEIAELLGVSRNVVHRARHYLKETA